MAVMYHWTRRKRNDNLTCALYTFKEAAEPILNSAPRFKNTALE
jgi:hypothetical protein